MGILLTKVEILIILATESGQYFPCEARSLATVSLYGLELGGPGRGDFPLPIVLNRPCAQQEADESVAKGHGADRYMIRRTPEAMAIGQLRRSLCENRPRGFRLEGRTVGVEMNEVVKLLRSDQLDRIE